MKQIRIPLLDNGHGKETPGKRSPVWSDGKQLFEYEFNRDIVRRIANMCDAEGVRYQIITPELTDIPLKDRCKRVNSYYTYYRAQHIDTFLLSIHANAGGGTGWECYTSKGLTAADAMATTLYECAEAEFSGDGWRLRTDYTDKDPDKEADFYILKHTICPAVLTENFFMDTEHDCRFIMSEEGRARVARMHFEAIRKIIGL